MEKLDAIVAGAGALVLVIAIAGAAVTGGGGVSSFDLVVVDHAGSASQPARAHSGEATVRESFDAMLGRANVTHATFTVSATFAAGPGAQAAMHVKLTAPNGTSFEQDAKTTAPGVGGTQAVASAVFDVGATRSPEDRTLRGVTQAEALREANASANLTTLEPWKIEVSFSAGPVPLPVSIAWRADFSAFDVIVRPAASGAR